MRKEPRARVGHFLVFVLRLQAFTRVADRDRSGKARPRRDATAHGFTGQAPPRLVEHPQEAMAFQDGLEGVPGVRHPVVRRSGSEPAEDIRGRRCRAFEGGTDAQAVISALEAVALSPDPVGVICPR